MKCTIDLLNSKEKWTITEELKQTNQMEWVRQMNLIKRIIEQIVYDALIMK